MISVLALHPLDVIKTRLQVQDCVDRRAATYRGTVHAFRTVVRREGALGLYSGLTPALVGSTVAWGVYFSCYNNAKARYQRAYDTRELPSHLHLISAAEAGLVVSLATNPIWVVKTRLQLQSRAHGAAGKTAPPPYRGFIDALTQIARAEGVAGLYKGLSPSLFLVSHGAIQFTAYERLKRIAETTRENVVVDQWLGAPRRTVRVRVRVVRRRVQTLRVRHHVSVTGGARADATARGGGGDGGGGGRDIGTVTRGRYVGFAQSLGEIVRREGAAGLYKGMVPNVLRTLPSSGVTILVYESTRSMLSREATGRRSSLAAGVRRASRTTASTCAVLGP